MPEPGDNNNLVVRRAQAAEDAELADLFNRVHAGLAGPAVRTAADLAWRCRRQPGCSDEGAILVETTSGKLLGYAFVKDSGDILELVVAPEGPRGRVTSALITACEARAEAAGAERIRVNVPIIDEEVADALAAVGLAPSRAAGRFYVSTMDPGRLTQILASELGEGMWSRPVEIVLSDPLPWQPARSVVGSNESSDRGPTLSMECRQRTLNQLLLRGASPWAALMLGRLRIRPVGKTVAGIRLLKRIQIQAPWFHTLGDVL